MAPGATQAAQVFVPAGVGTMSHVTAGDADRSCFAVAGARARVAGPGSYARLAATVIRWSWRIPSRVAWGSGPTGPGLYAANLHLRIASRVLVRVGSFHASAFDELERHAARLPWPEFLAPGSPVEFRVTSRKSRLYHQDAVAQRLLGGGERRALGVSPAASSDRGARRSSSSGSSATSARSAPTPRASCCTAAATGSALAKAPLRETLAAAMLVAIGLGRHEPLIDPMCGSGTIPIEAALLARRIPPGLGRDFACMGWPGFDAAAWERVVRRGAGAGVATGAGADSRAPIATRARSRRRSPTPSAPASAADIEWRRAAVSAIAPPPGPGWIVTNPPYGVRVGDRRRLRDLYAQLGNVARRCCPGWGVAFLAAHAELERQTGLEPMPCSRTENGGIRVRLVRGRAYPAGATPDDPVSRPSYTPCSRRLRLDQAAAFAGRLSAPANISER